MDDIACLYPHTGSSLFSTQLEKPPSCLEFCPLTSEYLVIGTYLLTEESSPRQQQMDEDTEDATAAAQSRSGSLILMKINPATGAE